jgi:hypothetical protein
LVVEELVDLFVVSMSGRKSEIQFPQFWYLVANELGFKVVEFPGVELDGFDEELGVLVVPFDLVLLPFGQ